MYVYLLTYLLSILHRFCDNTTCLAQSDVIASDLEQSFKRYDRYIRRIMNKFVRHQAETWKLQVDR